MADQKPWRETIASMYEAPTVTAEVGGTEIRFWPISLSMLGRLRSIGRPLAQSIGIILGGGQNDVRQEMVQSDDTAVDSVEDTDDDGNTVMRKVLTGVRGTHTSRHAISVELARFRADQKERAIDKLVEAISSEENQLLIAQLIFDSCREVFPRKPTDIELKEFVNDSANLVMVGQFIAGILKANAQTLGKLGEQLTDSVAKAVRARMSVTVEDGETEGQTPTSSPTRSESPTLKMVPTPPPPPPST